MNKNMPPVRRRQPLAGWLSLGFLLLPWSGFAQFLMTNTVYLPNDGSFSSLVNQLDHGSNALTEVLQNLPDNTTLLKWDCTVQDWSATVYTYYAAQHRWIPDGTLSPGEGTLITLGGGGPNPYPVQLTGTPHVPVLPVPLPCGYGQYHFLGRQTNDIGTYENITGLSPAEGAGLKRWNVPLQDWDLYTFSNNAWSPGVPTLNVAEAALISVPPLQSYTVNLHAGWNLIANHLDHGSNALTEVFSTNIQDQTALVLYHMGSCSAPNQYWYETDGPSPDNWYTDSSLSTPVDPHQITFAPGDAAFINATLGSFNITFSGHPHVPVLPVPLGCGPGTNYFLSRQTNGSGDYQNVTGLSPSEGAQVGRWNGAGYTLSTFSGGAWTPNSPTLNVGEAARFFIPASNVSYTINIHTGLNLIANQLDHGSNALNEIMPNVPDGSILYKYVNSSTWSNSSYSAAQVSWVPALVTLKPGEGAFFQSPTNFTLTLTGQPHVPVLPVSIPNGTCYLLSRQTNEVGDYANIVGVNPSGGETVYMWNGSNYTTFFNDQFGAGWSPAAPQVPVGAAVWIAPAGGSPAILPTNPPPSSYTVSLHAGWNLIANQLDHGSNALADVFSTNFQDQTALVLYHMGSCSAPNQYWYETDGPSPDNWYTDSSLSIPVDPRQITFAPGDAAFINATLGSFNITFSGHPHVPVLPVPLGCGPGTIYFLSRQTNGPGDYQNVTGLSPSEGAQVGRWNGAGYTLSTFSGGAWTPNSPTLNVGEAARFFIPVGEVSYTINIHTGLNLIANHVDHGSNMLNEIFPDVPDGSILYKYVNSSGTWSNSYYSATLDSWVPALFTLKPGEGAFFQSPTNFILTLSGQPHVPVLPVTIPNGACYLLSRQTNEIGDYANIVGVNPSGGETVYMWNGSNYTTFFNDQFGAGWSPAEPQVPVGAAVWIAPAGGSPAALPSNPFTTFAGLIHLPLGSATLSVNSNQLTLANIGTNGQDGVTILTGPVEGFTTLTTLDPTTPVGASELSSLWLPPGESDYGTMAFQVGTERVSQGYAAIVDFSALGSPTFTAQIYDRRTNLVFSASGLSGQDVSFAISAAKPKRCKYTLVPPKAVWRIGYTDDSSGGDDATFTLTGSQTNLVGNQIVFTPDKPPRWTNDLWTTLVNLTVANMPQFQIQGEFIQMFGLDHQGLGQALFKAEQSPTRLTVANIGSNGQDGATIVMPANVSGWGALWQPLDPNLPIGASLTEQIIGSGMGVTDQTLGSVITEKTSDTNYVMSADFSALGVTNLLVQSFNGTNLVGQANQTGGPVFPLGSCAAMEDDFEWHCCPWVFKKTHYTPLPLPPCPPCLPADTLALLPQNVSGLAVAAVNLTASQISSVTITNESITVNYAGVEHTSLGIATLTVQSNQLTIGNLESDGNDGVAIALPNVMQWGAQWEPLDPDGTLNVGAFLQMKANGTANNVTNGLLQTITVTKGSSNTVVTADFSPMGVNNITVQLYNGTNLVGQATGLTNGPLLTMLAFKIVDVHIDKFPPYRSWLTLVGVPIRLGNAAAVVADSAAIIPQGVSISQMPSTLLIQASQIPTMVLTNEFVSPMVLNSTFAGKNLTLQWLGTAHLQSSMNLTSWTNVPNVVSPYTVPIGATNQFYRLSQPLGNWRF
jgi:hypothetical protein